MTRCLHDFGAKLNRRIRRFSLFAFALVASIPSLALANGAVVVMYHRVGEEASFPSTSVSKEQFEAHMTLLENGPYTVLSLEKVAEALSKKEKLPDRAVSLTFDDAYLSVYESVWPRLKAAGFPFTIFVSTRSIDSGAEGFMSWDQIREMKAAGVSIGNHTRTHLHMAAAGEDRNRDEIRHVRERFKKELALTSTLFAYPYGEMSSVVRELVIDEGFLVAFGQHSGVAHASDDLFFLPRFAFNKRYGDLDRFRRAVNALPLPVQEITPADPLVAVNPPAFGFSVDSSLSRLDQLACYHSQFGKTDVMRLGERRIEIRFKGQIGRAHV